MLLRLLVLFYFSFDATLLVAQYTQYHEDSYDSVDLLRRQDASFGFGFYDAGNFREKRKVITTASTNNPITLKPSFEPLGSAWGALTSPSQRVIIWDPVPDISALPLKNIQQFKLTKIQSSGCSPPCASSGTCSPSSASCICPHGFNGTLCETCAENFFGPSCQPCPSNCKNCDQGITGSGLCLVPKVKGTTCDCENGVCDSNGKCKCLSGWSATGSGGKCVGCGPGFYSTKSGGCQACQIGCSSCADLTGDCNTCENNLTQNPTNKAQCDPPPNLKPNGTPCPTGSYSDGTNNTHCPECSPKCETCTGTASKCERCAPLLAMRDGNCVRTDGNGNCEGSNGTEISDNNNRQCQSCGAVGPYCVSCQIPNFAIGSTLKNAICTQCLKGFFLLSNGTCVKTCPANFFASDNSCKKCSSACDSCFGDSKHCLTCKSEGQFAFSGKCVTACPKGTFPSKGNCVNCHPDCETCNGGKFNQCASCGKDLPVPDNGRCVPTCKRSEFLDPTTSTCKNCDPSCSSCSGPEPAGCLACTNPQVYMLINGTCVPTPQLAMLTK